MAPFLFLERAMSQTTNTVTPAHTKALEKAKIALMTSPDSVFFCEIAFSLRYEWDRTLPTAAVDGKTIFINPEFFMDLTLDERVFLILHEALHVAYLHITRRGTREHRKWNKAGDYVINGHLIARGFKMPEGGLHDRKYDGMHTDAVYVLLPDEPANESDPSDIMEPAETGNGSTDQQVRDDLEHEIEQILVRAAIRSEQEKDKPGTIPGDIEIFLKKLTKPELPWHRILQKYINTLSKTDYSFKRPNKRFIPHLYMPSLRSETLMDIAIAVDTSGSVSDEDFNKFISNTAHIFKMMKPQRITLIQFDTEIKAVDEIKSFHDLMRVRFTGRGCTNINPVVDWYNQHPSRLLLVFTDGGFHAPKNEVKKDLIWLIHNNSRFTTAFGKVIHYKL